ncbi:MAG: flagellar filament capping protein FliD [Gammaproteobacteria bacterium]|nr:flagellar filament capping protein FliD [Gammaproteobacteria bacterium]MDH3768330.1 flagellar filament capping protein FliD [Gammaproteobacteria bacterium]
MLTSPGIGSGLDIESLVTQLVALEGRPAADRLSRREAVFQAELSGLGTFRAALDGFRSALEPLKDLNEFGSRIASSSDEEVFTVTSDNNVVPSDYSIEVVSLAQAQKLSSGAFLDADSFVGTGTLDITLGAASVSVDILDSNEATLANIRDAINNVENNPGVVASIVNAEDGAHLVLTSTETGKANTITVTASGGDGGLTVFDYDPPTTTNLTEVQAATDAEILIDSFTHFSTTNVVTGAIEGLTVELLNADPGNTATLSVSVDKDNARTLVEDFVDAYNSLLDTANELTRYNPETREAGLLQGNSIVSSLTDRLSREFNTTITGNLASLRDLNLSISLGGKIEIDANDIALQSERPSLDDVLAENFNDVGALFADKTDGFAVRFDGLLDEYLKFDGLLDVRSDGLQINIDGIEDSRDRLDLHLVAVEKRLRTQFLALDSLISQLNGTSGFLSSQLSNLVRPDVLLGRN